MAFEPPPSFNIADYFLAARLREGRGERIALRLDDRTMTYAEVARLAGRFAHVLSGLDVGPQERVLLALPDGPEFVGALFGALLSGGVAVMVNPGLEAAELAALLAYSEPRVAVVHRDALDRFEAARRTSGATTRLLSVGVEDDREDAFEALAREVPDHFESVPTRPDDPALWLFSGGTTGRPKAVVQTHRAFANTTELYAKATLGYRESDITLSVPKLYFGYATGSNLFFPFAVGASAILFPEHPTPEVLFERIRRQRPTILVNVPTLVQRMVRHPDAAAQNLSSLRFATSAGEALPAALHRRWTETFGVELLDGLGTAEMWHIFITNRPGDVVPGTLGRPVEGFDVRVRDPEGRDLPAGEVGRLWVRGGSLALGYWQDAERSREAFRGEWFAAGDLVCRNPDGTITYCGRSDDVLKVGGKWLVPREVEGCLLQHPAVAECAVIGAPDATGLVKPYAFVVPAEGCAGDEAELRRHCLERLAAYKHPRRVSFLDAMPRTHLGKIDRGALRRLATLE